ncbi:BACON domain-containing protein [Bacteroides sp. 3_1_23]|uniref:BACON domain-containing protein n=1 Tax=Bacteroides sp. 3_1_23 TaxID=457390 RepID=UPI0002FB17B2|nr:BACON domain-containing protein [Bacteroides sp. 3_1_23]
MRYFLFILLVGLLSACSSDDESNAGATAAKLEVSKNEVKLSNVDGSFTINVTATSTWTAEVTSTGDWLTISKSSGEGNGDLRLFLPRIQTAPSAPEQ